MVECKRCIMNSSADKNLFLDDDSVCNHCQRYDSLVESRVFSDKGKSLNKLIEKIKKAGKNKDFDCIVGVSGGVDSTYVA